MPTKFISIRNNELYLNDITVKASRDSNGNTWLNIEFVATSEDAYPQPTPDDRRYKREIALRNTGKGIASDSYRVKTTPNGANTKFLVETKIAAKIPGTGPEVRKAKKRK